MTDVSKLLDTVLRSPGHINAVLALVFGLASWHLFAAPVPEWPASLWSQGVVARLFLLIALICGGIVISQVVRFFLVSGVRGIKKSGEKRSSEARVNGLSGRAKAALRLIGNSGIGYLFAHPTSNYVEELRASGLISVDEVGEDWGRYDLTSDGYAVVHHEFARYRSFLIFSDEDAQFVKAEFETAAGNYRI